MSKYICVPESVWYLIHHRFGSNKSVVVFCQSKKGAESLSLSLCRSLRLPTASTAMGAKTPLTFEDPKLRGLVRQGFGFHHAGECERYWRGGGNHCGDCLVYIYVVPRIHWHGMSCHWYIFLGELSSAHISGHCS